MPDPSNAEASNRADPVTYWRIGRAHCPTCGTVKAYVARVDVSDLVCDCGTVCLPAHTEEPEGP